MQKISILFLLSMYSIISYGQELKEYSTKEYSIEYPEEWTFDSSGQMNTTFILFSKLEKNDTFSENVNLMIQDLTGMNLDLQGYTSLSVKQIKSIKDSEIIESKNLKSNGIDYHQIIWKGFVAGRDLQFKQLFFLKGNKAYLVTLTCEQKAYTEYVNIGTSILNSFTLK